MQQPACFPHLPTQHRPPTYLSLQAALEFSPGGTLLATASVAGHSINLFRIVPPPPVPAGADGLVGGGGTASLQGHAVWLYRLYRGVTPAAIRGISFAPDAAWVSASSGRGTTHLFHTPAAAPGAQQAAQLQPPQQQAQPGDTGVVGQPPKQPAVGRARKPGLLSGSVAGAATSAARNLYAGQPTGARCGASTVGHMGCTTRRECLGFLLNSEM